MRFFLAIFAVLFFLSTLAYGDQFQDAKAAYDHGDYEASLKILRPLADHGNARAQERIGSLYAHDRELQVVFKKKGQLGAPDQDNEESRRWYSMAAEGGDACAQLYVGLIYEGGNGETHDYASAMKWYLRAADQAQLAFDPTQPDNGDASSVARWRIGLMYEKGLGVNRDWLKVYYWWALAKGYGTNLTDIAVKHITQKQRTALDKKIVKWRLAHSEPPPPTLVPGAPHINPLAE